MPSFSRLAQWVLFIGLLPALGCASVQSNEPLLRASAATSGDILYAVNGAGDFGGMSGALGEAFDAEHGPVKMVVYHWSHGYRRILADQCCFSHAVEQGEELARILVERRKLYPKDRIFLFAHCAGAPVALAAAERVPAGTIDRMVMLAPSVSSQYDLRGALRGCTDGIDVFCSEHDNYLRYGLFVLGAGDRRHFCSISGRHGFKPVIKSPDDEKLYSKLHHHRWSESVAWTGHEGGHYGAYATPYMRTYILTLLNDGPQDGVPPDADSAIVMHPETRNGL
ncbi:MAG: hypothetical protein AB7K24_25220 [Gemmataceae bacterium]